MRDLILKMLAYDPKQRITIYEILEHKWMTIDDEELEKCIEEAKSEFEHEEEIAWEKLEALKLERE